MSKLKCYCGAISEILIDKATREILYYGRCTNKDCRFCMGFKETEEEMIKMWKKEVKLMKESVNK